jgi:hypothetical protein
LVEALSTEQALRLYYQQELERITPKNRPKTNALDWLNRRIESVINGFAGQGFHPTTNDPE